MKIGRWTWILLSLVMLQDIGCAYGWRSDAQTGQSHAVSLQMHSANASHGLDLHQLTQDLAQRLRRCGQPVYIGVERQNQPHVRCQIDTIQSTILAGTIQATATVSCTTNQHKTTTNLSRQGYQSVSVDTQRGLFGLEQQAKTQSILSAQRLLACPLAKHIQQANIHGKPQ